MLKFLYAFCMLLFSAVTADACTQSRGYTDAENFSRADYVFVAHLYRIEEVPPALGQPRPLFNLAASFRLIEALKGDVPASGIIVSSLANCYGPLFAGLDNVFFAERDETGRIVDLGFAGGTRDFLPNVDRSIIYLDTFRRLSAEQAKQKP